MFKTLWKILPLGFRNFSHKIFHRLNSLSILIFLFSFRHRLTKKKLLQANSSAWLRVGESRFFEGWISSNYQVLTRNFLDATKPYGSNTCQYIYADNVIEHLNRQGGKEFLRQSYRALIPGGVLRIATPNLENLVLRYQRQSQEDLHQFASDLASHNLEIQEFSDLLRITFSEFGHHKGIIYDFDSLNKAMSQAGFINIKQYIPGVSEIDSLKNLETRMAKSDIWSQMVVEGTKP
jgi:predicted SAM-dependent methyltransferase